MTITNVMEENLMVKIIFDDTPSTISHIDAAAGNTELQPLGLHIWSWDRNMLFDSCTIVTFNLVWVR